VNTSKEPAPAAERSPGRQADFGGWPAVPYTPVAVIDPNNPPWGLVAAFLAWLASVLLLFGMAFLFLVPYAALKSQDMSREELHQFLATDKTAILLTVLSGIPAHLLTLGVVWAIVTRFGKRPFWETLGWSRGKGFGYWTSAGAAALLYLIGVSMIYLFRQEGVETAMERIVGSSRTTALAIAFMAVVTAPLVEELVYRGVLYSALQKAAGKVLAVVGVMVLFTIIHVPQYWPNYGIIGAVCLLSISLTLVRAYTGRLLPCFIMHLVFNAIQAVLIILEPYLRQLLTRSETAPSAVLGLSKLIRPFF
jgi:uncharacterized protein